MDVVFERFNFAAVEDLLEALGDRARPPRIFDVWNDILDETLVAERRLFSTARGWPDTKDATKARKRRDKDPQVRANADKVNVASGAMRDFMTTRSPSAQPLKMDADELRIGIPGGRSDIFYARFQQQHGRDPRVSRAVIRRIVNQRMLEHLTGR